MKQVSFFYHFKLPLAIAGMAIGGLFYFMYIKCATISDSDRAVYRELEVFSNLLKKKSDHQDFFCRQQREKILKHIIIRENKKWDLELKSDFSDFVLKQQENKSDFQEEFQKTTCYIREIVEQAEKKGIITADTVTYKYKDGSIFGKNVLAIEDSKVQFSSDEFLWNPITKVLTLTGQVKMQNFVFSFGNTPYHCLANKMEYNQKSKQIDLFARMGEKVKIYDCINRFQMSAPAFHVKQDKSSGKRMFEGEGKVQFVFDVQDPFIGSL